MRPEGSLLYSQQPATYVSPEPDQSGPRPLSHFLKMNFNIILPSTPSCAKLSLSHHNPVCTSPLPVRVTCFAHLILMCLITLLIFCAKYRSISFSLCSLLHDPVTPSLLGPYVSLSTLSSHTLNLRSSVFPSV